MTRGAARQRRAPPPCSAPYGPPFAEPAAPPHRYAHGRRRPLDALGIRRVDFDGDSYGSYAGQAFAARHGERLRSLVIDAYPLPGTDPAFGDLAEATWRALRLVCERRPSCAARGEDPVAVVQRLVDAVRARPVRGTGRNTNGRRTRVRLDETSLAALLQSGYGNVPMYRDIVAAIRAFEAGDRAPPAPAYPAAQRRGRERALSAPAGATMLAP